MRVEHLYRYPVKGLSAEALEQVELREGECIAHDRQFALVQGDAPFDPAAPRFLPKQNFACLMVNARLALVASAYDGRSGQLSLSVPGAAPLLADTRSPEGRASIATLLSRYMADEARGNPYFTEASAHNFTDQKTKGISLINMASLEALEAAIGQKLDLLRFRANLYFTGLPAWAEFDWVDREILVGGARLQVFKRTVRCPATQVNLRTGEHDLDIPRLLRQHFGHADLGVHARVLEGGRVALGDSLEAPLDA